MTDVEFIAQVKTITDPVEMLEALLNNDMFLGYDPYYADLRAALLDQAEQVVEAARLARGAGSVTSTG